jgi:hypothetical protein
MCSHPRRLTRRVDTPELADRFKKLGYTQISAEDASKEFAQKQRAVDAVNSIADELRAQQGQTKPPEAQGE